MLHNSNWNQLFDFIEFFDNHIDLSYYHTLKSNKYQIQVLKKVNKVNQTKTILGKTIYFRHDKIRRD